MLSNLLISIRCYDRANCYVSFWKASLIQSVALSLRFKWQLHAALVHITHMRARKCTYDVLACASTLRQRKKAIITWYDEVTITNYMASCLWNTHASSLVTTVHEACESWVFATLGQHPSSKIKLHIKHCITVTALGRSNDGASTMPCWGNVRHIFSVHHTMFRKVC